MGTTGMRSVVLAIAIAANSRIAQAEPPRWAGSEIGAKTAAGVWTAIPGADPTWNPILLQTIAFDPIWRVRGEWRLKGHLAIETELTDSDATPRERQPLLDDAWLQSGHAIPWGGVAGVRFYLPTSRESWARRRLFTLQPQVAFARELGRLRGRVAASAAWHAATEEYALYDAPSILGCDPGRESCEAFMSSGIRSPMATFVQAVGLDVTLPHDLTATAEVWWIEGLLYPLAGSDSTRWRLSNLYLLGAEWRASPAWRLGAGLSTLNPQRAPDGSLYPPFFNRHTQLYVSLSRVF